jgi:hypothetical protein
LANFHSHPSKYFSRHSLFSLFSSLRSSGGAHLLRQQAPSHGGSSPLGRRISQPAHVYLPPHRSFPGAGAGSSSPGRAPFQQGRPGPDGPCAAPPRGHHGARRLSPSSAAAASLVSHGAPFNFHDRHPSSSPSPRALSPCAQKFQQQGLHSSSSSTLLFSLAQTSPMARCSRRPRASPPWLATWLPPCLRAAAQCPVGACYVLDEMCSKPRVVDFLQQPRRLCAARCFVLSSGQHAVDARRWLAVFAQPHPRRR